MYGSASSGYESSCCPPVVDPYTWLALISGIALATYFLRITITTTLKRKKRRKREEDDKLYNQASVVKGILRIFFYKSITNIIGIQNFGDITNWSWFDRFLQDILEMNSIDDDQQQLNDVTEDKGLCLFVAAFN